MRPQPNRSRQSAHAMPSKMTKRTSTRAQLPVADTYLPEWKGEIEGYVMNTITRHGWRVESTHRREDLKQEAYIVFMRCAAKYPMLDTPQHFMSLFKRAWTNALNDLSVK